MGWWRGDINAKLITLKDTLDTQFPTVTDAITALRGTGTFNTIAALYAKIGVIESTLDANIPLINGNILDIVGALATLDDRIDKIQAALGAAPYNSTEIASARSFLWAILQALQSNQIGTPPTTSTSDIVSNGSIVVGARKYAYFLAPITNVTVANNGYDLTRSPSGQSWLGWNAYIQTTDPAPQVAGAADLANKWIALSGIGTINFSVASSYSISVYLRPSADSGYVWYYDLGEIASVSTGSGNRWLPSPTKYAGQLTFSSIGGNPRVLTTASNWGRWLWQITGNSPQSVYGTNGLSVVSNSPSGTIPIGATNQWVIQFYNAPGSGASIRIVQPTGS
jgi:hypothetical protein